MSCEALRNQTTYDDDDDDDDDDLIFLKNYISKKLNHMKAYVLSRSHQTEHLSNLFPVLVVITGVINQCWLLKELQQSILKSIYLRYKLNEKQSVQSCLGS